MKVLFIARHFTYFRNFDSVVSALAARGHRVHLAADRDDAFGGGALVERLVAANSKVTSGVTPIHEWGRYRRVAGALRLALDYLRYSDPHYEAMPRIRQRAYERTPAFALVLARWPGRRLITRALERLEEAVPRQAGVDEFIREHQPDLLLITPLIELGSPQLDYVRAAKRLGVRSALCVWSWDHLSSKALVRVVPDAVIVWNEVQREEAARFHGIPGDRVRITGAQCFDRWFNRQPSLSRDAFCRRAGLPDDKPFVLYVCSALFRGSPSEAAFVREWVRAVRRSDDPVVQSCNILVRPHPQRLDDWAGAEPLDGTAPGGTAPGGTALGGTALWGSNPIDDTGRADYFDSLHHSAAVVGINTSALVEAAIVDRPVYTIMPPEYHDNQEGTYHFHHLLTVGDGFMRVARTLSEHVAQLGRGLRGDRTSNAAFVERFIRPHGAAVAASDVFVRTAEDLVSGPPPAPVAAPFWVWALRPVVYALVLTARLPFVERIYWNPAKFRQVAST